jgi:hypothetical protein
MLAGAFILLLAATGLGANPGPTLVCRASHLVSSQGVAGVNANAHDVASLNALQIEVLQSFIADFGIPFGGIHSTLYSEEPFEQGGAHVVVKGDGDIVWNRVLRDCVL